MFTMFVELLIKLLPCVPLALTGRDFTQSIIFTCSRAEGGKYLYLKMYVLYLLLASLITMSGWPGDDEQSQAVHDDDSPHLYIDYTADPLMGLPIYPDHRHDQVVHRSHSLHPGHDVVAAGPVSDLY
jgi:hypothetical protein